MRKIHPQLFTSVIHAASEEFPFCLEGLVCKLENGRLMATYTAGGISEPRLENRTFFAFSDDDGRTWTEPQVLFSHSTKGLFTSTFYSYRGTIRAHFNTYYNTTTFGEDIQSYYSESNDGGATFSLPRSLPGCLNNLHIKQALPLGDRLLLACSWRETDGSEWCFPALASESKPAMVGGKPTEQCILPDALTVEERMCAYGAWAAENTHEYVGVLISDDGGRTYRLCGRLGDALGQRVFCEPTVTQLADGSLLMFVRCNTLKTVFESRSTDSGEHWSPLAPLDLPTPISKARLYTRKNGDVLLLHNPSTTGRSPLSLWISHDSAQTWAEKIDLVADDAYSLAYPDGFIDEENNRICFAWDDRQNIYYSTFPLGK